MENSNYSVPAGQNQPVNLPPANSENKGLIAALLAVIVVLLLVIGVIAGYFVYNFQKNNAFNQEAADVNFTDDNASVAATDQTSDTAENNLVNWQEPQIIPSLGVFKNVSDVEPGLVNFNPEKDAKYYKVGIVNDGRYKGGEIVLVSAQIDAPALYPGFYRFIKTADSLVLLKKYSEAVGTETGLNEAKFTIDENFDIPQLNFPETISGPAPHETLELYPYVNSLFSLNNLKKVFTDSKLGDVYTSSAYDPTNADLFKRNGFYIQSPDGTVRVYSLKIDFIANGSAPAITWSGGVANKTDYKYTDQTGCGSANFASVLPEGMVNDQNLKISGQTSLGDNVYELIDTNNFLRKDLYNNKSQVLDGKKKISYRAFLATHPLFFWRDPFGRLIKFESSKYAPLAECGKPVIYLYPKQAGKISVQVEPQGGMTYSDPVYGNGWNVWSDTDSNLTELATGKKYPYLFWEGKGGLYEQPKKGFVVKRFDVHGFLIEKLTALGLNKKEIADFIEFWEPRMQGSLYYFVTFLGNTQMDRLAPLSINPKPDTVIRILMDFSPLSKPITVEGYNIATPVRNGFTVVEWGGVIR